MMLTAWAIPSRLPIVIIKKEKQRGTEVIGLEKIVIILMKNI